VLENTTATHGAPVFVNVVNDALLRLSKGDPSYSITVRSAPFPFSKRESDNINNNLAFTAVLFIVIAFSFIPASFAVFVVKEREINAKHQQV
jgi:ATP-binding cassette subfamily A (ABC1) protein 3